MPVLGIKWCQIVSLCNSRFCDLADDRLLRFEGIVTLVQRYSLDNNGNKFSTTLITESVPFTKSHLKEKVVSICNCKKEQIQNVEVNVCFSFPHFQRHKTEKVVQCLSSLWKGRSVVPLALDQFERMIRG